MESDKLQDQLRKTDADRLKALTKIKQLEAQLEQAKVRTPTLTVTSNLSDPEPAPKRIRGGIRSLALPE